MSFSLKIQTSIIFVLEVQMTSFFFLSFCIPIQNMMDPPSPKIDNQFWLLKKNIIFRSKIIIFIKQQNRPKNTKLKVQTTFMDQTNTFMIKNWRTSRTQKNFHFLSLSPTHTPKFEPLFFLNDLSYENNFHSSWNNYCHTIDISKILEK